MKISCFLFSAVIATSLLSTDHAIASGAPIISFTGGIASKEVNKGEIFHEASFSVDYTGGPVILSANPDGTGDTLVDDVLLITVIGPDAVARTYRKDYSNGCMGLVTAAPPVDLTDYFQVGRNEVRVVMKDLCGDVRSASSLWLLP